jgi:hypothetical protein
MGRQKASGVPSLESADVGTSLEILKNLQRRRGKIVSRSAKVRLAADVLL